jgi:phospholipase D1/2
MWSSEMGRRSRRTNGMVAEPQTTQLLLHGVIEATILEADLSVTTDGKLQPTKKVRTYI